LICPARVSMTALSPSSTAVACSAFTKKSRQLVGPARQGVADPQGAPEGWFGWFAIQIIVPVSIAAC
jgi:hypothetical protein